ncbi:MAG: hypothetical protein GEU79_13815 [Acidimicrobiia bacterium]|nr:hypothetical protein [Acidimicrobiia bacterium]
MSDVLREFPHLGQLRRQAKELHLSARAADPAAVDELSAVSSRVDLNSAQLALARRYGFGSWPRLKLEVERKNAIHHGDIEGLRQLVSEHPALAFEAVSSCFDNDSALGYIGVARFHGLTDHDRAGEVARVLLDAGGAADGPVGAAEPPLVTAASYGEVDMVRVLVGAGAGLEVTGFAVPGGTALAHAVEFGNGEVVDVLAAAGAVVHDLVETAGVGKLDEYELSGIQVALRARACRAAAVCERLETLDQLLASGVSVDADPDTGHLNGSRTLLHEAAYWGKPRSVQHLLALGADPNRRDTEHGSTPLGWCRHRLGEIGVFGEHLTEAHRHVELILQPVTADS